MYVYKANIDRVIDGDTVVATIDLGFNVSVKQTLRLAGIDAPETRGRDLTDEQRQAGHDATEHLKWLIGTDPVSVHTLKDKTGKYGRYLAVIYSNNVNLNESMIRDGHAVREEE